MRIKKATIRRKPLVFIVAALAVGAVGIITVQQSMKDNTTGSPSNNIACTILDKEVVNQASKDIGELTLSKQDVTIEDNQGITMSTCSYKEKGGNDGSELTASLTVRTANTKKTDSLATLKKAYASAKPKDSQEIGGYTKGNYWDSKTGALSILSDDRWYILTYGPAKPTTAPQFTDVVALSELVVPRFAADTAANPVGNKPPKKP